MATTKDEKVLQEALELFEESQDGSDYNRNEYFDDIAFSRLGEQWPEHIQRTRVKETRPCLTVNRMPSFIRQVVNDAKMNKPGINVRPVDNGADEDTAEVMSGLVRSIERASTTAPYDTAIDQSVSGGFGFFRVDIEYEGPETFNQVARIKRIINPLLVHWDTSSTSFDASDWNYAFVSEFMSEEEYKIRFPGKEVVSFDAGAYTGDYLAHWLEDNQVRVAEYFKRTPKTRKLLKLSNGQAILEEDFEKLRNVDQAINLLLEAGELRVVGERDSEFYEIMHYVMNGHEILEEKKWPGTLIPVIPVWGEEVVHDGRRWFRSMIRDAKDSQTMYNFWRTATTEMVALAPRTPYIGPKDFVPKGHEEAWRTANTRNHAYLEYVGDIPPQRQPMSGVPAGMVQESLSAADDMKSVMGIYDAALGARSNETSGRAILARQREADVSNYHFIDNLNAAMQYCGKVLVELIPHLYSGRQSIRILGEDMAEKVIDMTQPRRDGKVFDLSVGTYDVEVKSGPSFTTQREETRETLIEIMRAVPDSAQFVGDVLLDHMDFQGADKVANRLRMLLPPAVREAETREGFDQMSDDAQAIAMSAQQTITQLQQALQAAQKQLEDNKAEQMKAQADVVEAQTDRQYKARQLQQKDAEIALKGRQVALQEKEAERDAYESDRDYVDSKLERASEAMLTLAQTIADDRGDTA